MFPSNEFKVCIFTVTVKRFQSFIKERLSDEISHPSFFAVQVGSTDDYYTTDDISTFVKKEIVKIHFETDAQWAYWNGVKQFCDEKEEYLRTQVNRLFRWPSLFVLLTIRQKQGKLRITREKT